MSANTGGNQVQVNGKDYRWAIRPTVVICFDGCDPAYIAASGSAGHIPTISRFLNEGFYAIADSAMPTFTNPNKSPSSAVPLHLSTALLETITLTGRQDRKS